MAIDLYWRRTDETPLNPEADRAICRLRAEVFGGVRWIENILLDSPALSIRRPILSTVDVAAIAANLARLAQASKSKRGNRYIRLAANIFAEASHLRLEAEMSY